MPITRVILNSHSVATLRKEIAKTNIRGYSKMSKAELVEVMMKNAPRFSHIKMAEKKPRATATKPKAKEEKPQPKKIIKIKRKGKEELSEISKAIAGSDLSQKVAKTKDVKPKKKYPFYLSTPPILPYNEKNAKKLLEFMEKEDKKQLIRAGITQPATGFRVYEFEKLGNGGVYFRISGRSKFLAYKKIMKYLKGVKSGKIMHGRFLIPEYYRKYLNMVGFDDSVPSDMLYKK